MATTGIGVSGSRLIELTGDKALARELQKLPEKARKKVLRPSIKFALTPVVKEATKNVSVRFGFLREEIGKKVSATKAWGKVYVKSAVYYDENGVKHKPGHYAHLLEFGTKKMEAKPFMRNALSSKKSEAISRMAMKTRQNLNKLKYKDL